MEQLLGCKNSFLFLPPPWYPFDKEPFINDIDHLGGGGSAKRWRYSISLFSKMDDNLKKVGDVIYGWLLITILFPWFLLQNGKNENII